MEVLFTIYEQRRGGGLRENRDIELENIQGLVHKVSNFAVMT
jgi:hypothetical protein